MAGPTLEAEIDATALKLSRERDSYSNDPLRCVDWAAAGPRLQKARFRQYTQSHPPFFFDKHDVAGQRFSSSGAKNDISFEQTLLGPGPVDGDAFVVCFGDAQNFYDHVFIVGINLQTPLLMRQYVFVFFHSILLVGSRI